MKIQNISKVTFLLCIILLFIGLFSLIGCDVSKNVRDKEVNEFTNFLLESNEEVKELRFYFRRPSLWGELVYDGDLDDSDLQSLVSEFKELIDIEFMQRIGDKYWGGSRPSGFYLNIYIDEKREDSYDYQIASDYNKTNINNEELDNIDGYETWRISGKKDTTNDELTIDIGDYTKSTKNKIKK